MKIGNFLGLPVNFLVFSIITVIVTAGTLQVFGEAIMDPVLIVEKIGNPVVVIVGSVTFIVATMGINIVANFVSPAYDIANLYPEKVELPAGRADHLDPLGAGLPVAVRCEPAGDHAVCQHLRRRPGSAVRDHHRRLLPGEAAAASRSNDLYTLSPAGSYLYDGGWNRNAVVALALSALLSIGLALAGAYDLILNVGDWGWLIGAGAAALLYRALSGRSLRAAEITLASSS